jgi:hypothetical protein
MRKISGWGLAGLLVGTTVLGATPAQAATSAGVAHARCQIPGSTFVFKYDINYTRSNDPDLGQKFTINNVKVTDAAHGHWVQGVAWEARYGGAKYMWGSGSWPNKYTKYPRAGRAGTVVETWVDTWQVTVKLTAYNNAGRKTPTCVSDTGVGVWA